MNDCIARNGHVNTDPVCTGVATFLVDFAMNLGHMANVPPKDMAKRFGSYLESIQARVEEVAKEGYAGDHHVH